MSRTDAISRQANRKDRGHGSTYFNMPLLDKHGIKLYKAKEENFLAIVPPEDPDEYFGYEFFPHFNIGFNDAKFVCPRMMDEAQAKRCPLCEEYRRLKQAECDDEQLMRNLNAFPPRFLFWVVDMSSEETMAEGVQLYDAPMTVNDEIISLSKNRRTGEFIDISDPENGQTVIFERRGKGKGARYQGFELEDREPLPVEWLESVLPFKDVLVIKDYAEILAAYKGEEVSDADKEPQEKRSLSPRMRSRVSRPTPRRASDEDTDAKAERGKPVSDTKEILEDIGDEMDSGVRRRQRRRATVEPADDDAADDDNDSIAETRRRMREKLRAKRGAVESDDSDNVDDDEVPF
jgi:hypothetical protein